MFSRTLKTGEYWRDRKFLLAHIFHQKDMVSICKLLFTEHRMTEQNTTLVFISNLHIGAMIFRLKMFANKNLQLANIHQI